MYVHDVEYQEEQLVLGENAVIENAWDAYRAEKAKDPKARRFIRIAREYVPKLQHIFWHGEMRDEAQEVLSSIMLDQTQPFNAIGDTYVEHNDDYVEAD